MKQKLFFFVLVVPGLIWSRSNKRNNTTVYR